MRDKIVVGITQGDTNGIGYEVIIKSLADARMLENCVIILYGSSRFFGIYRKFLPEIEQIATNVINAAEDARSKRVNIINAVPESMAMEIGQPTPDGAKAAVLALKAGSACVLRGGKEAFRSASAIVKAMKAGLEAAGLPADLVQLVQDTSRQSSTDLMTAVGLVDLLIPRGGAGLIRAVTENAKVPCIQTGTGICHVYVDAAGDQAKALDIIENAKTSRPSVCNAEEVLLVHSAIAAEFLPKLKQRLVDDRAARGDIPVELRLDARAAAIIPGTPASETDFAR